MNIDELMSSEDLEKLKKIGNKKVMANLEDAVNLTTPEKIVVITDSKDDIMSVRKLAIENGEETKLSMDGHTIHYDGINDQARDKANTKYLFNELQKDWGIPVNQINRDEGVSEVREIMKGIMKGKTMIVSFFCLGPTNSPFSIRCMQITDSAYVTHSEEILYRTGYEEFVRQGSDEDFFFFLHSAGELEDGKTKNVDKRRIYIDFENNDVYSVNNQYAGNSVGLKKLAFRLAIQKANQEDWLAEHMFLMGVHGKEDRVTYFTGAFPSGCGKTSTAMIPGQTIVGDDIAYLRKINGELRAVNVENGIFGIIQDVNAKDDPLIFDALTTPREVIYTNVLVNDGKPYWLGMGVDHPSEGVNFSGNWKASSNNPDENDDGVKFASKNARYTIRIEELANADKEVQNPDGVNVQGVVYGGRDSNTTIPVVESLSWEHGVFIGATIESETTAQVIGQEGVRKHNPMANQDFISLPMPQYIKHHLDFGKKFDNPPKVYGTNYFLKNKEGKYTNGKLDKKVWILWADGRVNGDFEAIKSPVGMIPKYDDLKVLFKKYRDHDYTEAEYVEQFTVRIDKYLEKMARMKAVYDGISMPQEFTNELDSQIKRLNDAKAKYGSEVSPYDL